MKLKFVPVNSVLWPVVEDALGIKWTDDTRGILAYDVAENDFVAGVVFQNWTHSAAMVHQWVEKPMVLRHGFYEEVCRYFFDDAGKKVMIGWVPGDNEEAIRFNKHLGFKVHSTIPDGFREGIGVVIMTGDKDSLARWCKFEEAA